jgi:hypothetical protein
MAFKMKYSAMKKSFPFKHTELEAGYAHTNPHEANAMHESISDEDRLKLESDRKSRAGEDAHDKTRLPTHVTNKKGEVDLFGRGVSIPDPVDEDGNVIRKGRNVLFDRSPEEQAAIEYKRMSPREKRKFNKSQTPEQLEKTAEKEAKSNERDVKKSNKAKNKASNKAVKVKIKSDHKEDVQAWKDGGKEGKRPKKQ